MGFFRVFRPKIARNVHDLKHRKLRVKLTGLRCNLHLAISFKIIQKTVRIKIRFKTILNISRLLKLSTQLAASIS